MDIFQKLSIIQFELKAPKNQNNTFGNYKYRSLEDICEAVKPLLHENKLTLYISDEPIMVGERTYIKATATLADFEKNTIVNHAYAREPLSKKGMDEAQITGATSSYARKYCLNGLFCIDDTKDADSMDNRKDQKRTTQQPKKTLTFLDEMKNFAQINYKTYKSILDEFKVDSAKSITDKTTQTKMLKKLRSM